MNSNDNRLSELLTGHEETDSRLQKAFELGLRQGKELDRESFRRNVQIDTTRRLLVALMATQHIDLQSAMKALRIPNADRRTFVKLFAAKQNASPRAH